MHKNMDLSTYLLFILILHSVRVEYRKYIKSFIFKSRSQQRRPKDVLKKSQKTSLADQLEHILRNDVFNLFFTFFSLVHMKNDILKNGNYCHYFYESPHGSIQRASYKLSQVSSSE